MARASPPAAEHLLHRAACRHPISISPSSWLEGPMNARPRPHTHLQCSPVPPLGEKVCVCVGGGGGYYCPARSVSYAVFPGVTDRMPPGQPGENASLRDEGCKETEEEGLLLPGTKALRCMVRCSSPASPPKRARSFPQRAAHLSSRCGGGTQLKSSHKPRAGIAALYLCQDGERRGEVEWLKRVHPSPRER